MPDAKGAVGAGAYPALSGNPRMRSATYAAMVIVRGQRGMPPFGDYLSDAQIADLVNYLRTNFGNHYTDRIAADDVKQLRFALPR